MVLKITIFLSFVLSWTWGKENPGTSYTLPNYLQQIFDNHPEFRLKSLEVKEMEAKAKSEQQSRPFEFHASTDNSNSSRLSTDTQDGVRTVESVSRDVETGIKKPLITGGDVDVSYGYSFTEGNSQRVPAGLRNYHTTFMSVRFNQPLFANMGNVFYRRNWRLASLSEKSAYLNFEQTVSRILQKGTQAYFDLRVKMEKRRLKSQAMEGNMASMKKTETLVSRELESRKKILELNAQRLQIESEVHQVEMEIQSARFVFFELLGGVDLGEPLRLITEPSIPDSMALAGEEILQMALKHRVDYKMSEKECEMAELNLEMKKSSTLPKLNLHSNYYVYGTDSDWDQAFSKLGGRDFHSWSVGLSFVVVVDRNHRRSQIAPLEIGLKRSRFRKEERRRAIDQELQSALGELRLTHRQYLLALASLELADQNFRETDSLFSQGFLSAETRFSAEKERDAARLRVEEIKGKNEIQNIQLLEKQGVLLSHFNFNPSEILKKENL